MSRQSLLIAAVGDLHGRFHRLQGWLQALEKALGRQVDAVFAVGDVEAFARADDHRRKAAKRNMPAEFSEYAQGTRTAHRPLYFIGGNNEDFEALHPLQSGGDLADEVHYLGRVGVKSFGGIRVGFLSGIFAPRFFGEPLVVPKNRETTKQAGYFRQTEVDSLLTAKDVDLLLVHEWPRGLFRSNARPGAPTPRPWMGNPVTRDVIAKLQPQWVFCGHSHMPWAATVRHPDRKLTHVACLDQAARPESAVLWMEWEGRTPTRCGWGVTGEVAWKGSGPWEALHAPDAKPEELASGKMT